MKKRKSNKSIVNEPLPGYDNTPIFMFKSFVEENEFVAKERAALKYDKRLENMELIRKQIYSEYLLPDGSWKPMAMVFKIMPPYTNDISK